MPDVPPPATDPSGIPADRDEAEANAWIDPDFEILEPDRIENNPDVGSDGGVGDCQHL
jgi:hypothetical protein